MIELPTHDAYIKAQLESKGLLGDYYSQLKKKKHEQEYRLALQQVQTADEVDLAVEEALTETYGETAAKKMVHNKSKDFSNFDLMNEERFTTFIRVMAQLQQEGK